MTRRASIPEAKTHLSRLIEHALRGEEVVIHRGDQAVRLVPVSTPKADRKFGAMKGSLRVPASFFDPLPDD